MTLSKSFTLVNQILKNMLQWHNMVFLGDQINWNMFWKLLILTLKQLSPFFFFFKIWFYFLMLCNISVWNWPNIMTIMSALWILTLGYYLRLTGSISWLLMPWLLTSPGHQQQWYWLYRICRSLSYLRKDFKYLCHINVEEWHKM